VTRKETSSEIEAAAAEWLVRLDRADGDERTQHALDAWLAGDDRRKGAFVRAQAAWRLLDRARALSPLQRSPAPRNRLVARRRVLVGGAALAATGAGAVIFVARDRIAPSQQFETGLGEQRVVAMNDGSKATLDTQTSLQVRFQLRSRSLTLRKGKAWFQVAKDRTRPFVIDAGLLKARAVGTAFSVDRVDDTVQVLVTEGVVEVLLASAGAPVRLGAAMQATLARDGSLRIEHFTNEAMSRSLAWREGKIALNGETVRQASEMFNRYNALKIVVADDQVGAQKVVGWFDSDDPQGFAQALEFTVGARSERVGSALRLTVSKK